MEEKDWCPSDKDMAAIAYAVDDFATKKCKEMGYPWYAKFIVVDRLHDAQVMYLKVLDSFGPEFMNKIAEAIEKSEMYDAIKQAEDALREGE